LPPVNIHEAARTHFPRIHRAALILCGNPWDADDLAQETFLVLARQPNNFQGKSSLYTWLYGVLLNLDRRQRRRFGIWRQKLRVMWGNQASNPTASPGADCTIEVREWKNSLWARVNQLPDGQRHALVLRFSEGLRYEEIADVLSCPLGTVKSRIFHGLAALRRILDAEGEDARRLPDFPSEDLSHAV
jgi:RNA polymerase sigma-70 factor (ECF subfamily)